MSHRLHQLLHLLFRHSRSANILAHHLGEGTVAQIQLINERNYLFEMLI